MLYGSLMDTRDAPYCLLGILRALDDTLWDTRCETIIKPLGTLISTPQSKVTGHGKLVATRVIAGRGDHVETRGTQPRGSGEDRRVTEWSFYRWNFPHRKYCDEVLTQPYPA